MIEGEKERKQMIEGKKERAAAPAELFFSHAAQLRILVFASLLYRCQTLETSEREREEERRARESLSI